MIDIDVGFWTMWAIIILTVTSFAWLCVRAKSPHVRIGWILAALIVSVIPALGRQITLPDSLGAVKSQIAKATDNETPVAGIDTPRQQSAIPKVSGVTNATKPVQNHETSFPYVSALVTLWISVALVLMIRTIIAATVGQRILKNAVTVGDSNLLRADVQTPMVAGFPKAYVIVPHDWPGDLSKEDADAVIHHEESHLKSRHISLRIFAEIARSWMWFSPASWALVRRLDEAFEQSADFDAIERGASAKGLARALVTLAGRMTGPTERFAIGAVHPGLRLEERIKKLKEHKLMKKQPHKTTIALIAVAAVAASAGAWTLTAQSARTVRSADFGLKLGAMWTYDVNSVWDDNQGYAGESSNTLTETAESFVDVQGKKAIELVVKTTAFPGFEYRYMSQTDTALLEYYPLSDDMPGIDQSISANPVVKLQAAKGESWSWNEPFRGIMAQDSGAESDSGTSKVEMGTHKSATIISTNAKVTVPAGTYTAIHIRTQSESDTWGDITIDSWYAPGVGLVKSVSKTFHRGEHFRTDERALTSFTPGK